MATIQIRDVPDDAYVTIRRRARAEGKSIQSYMRDHVVEFARARTKPEAMADIRSALGADRGAGVTADDVLADMDADRR